MAEHKREGKLGQEERKGECYLMIDSVIYSFPVNTIAAKAVSLSQCIN